MHQSKRNDSIKLNYVPSNPDILLSLHRTSTVSKSARIVELKVCRDTGQAEQLGTALSQHETLISELKNTGFTDVKVIPILVGASGTIYHQHTLDSLQALGLS